MGVILILQILILSWFARTCKSVLFWIYLWQLKEYHIGRFLDHFRTAKGKKIFFNTLFVAKAILLVLFAVGSTLFPVAFFLLFILYLTEFLLFIKNIAGRDLKMPKFTPKAVLLTGISFAVVIAYLFYAAQFLRIAEWGVFSFHLLAFDILLPFIVSLVVLAVQPLFVLARNNTLRRAREKMAQLKHVKVVGITGSYGKTSTKEFLTAILSSKYKVLSTKEHQNSEMGIAACILNDLNLKHEVFVVEMGAYKKGGIQLLCDMVKPRIGIVTGVNEQHLSLFGSLANLLSAEGGDELAQNLPLDGLMILNGDNEHCLELYKKINLRKRIYAAKKIALSADIWAEELEMKKDFISFVAKTKQGEMAHFKLNVLGGHNVQNLLGAVLAARDLGMSLEEIAQAAKNITQAQAGINLKKGIHGIDVIDSSYSSNPDGVFADLDYLNIFPSRKVIVMPCLIELGNASGQIHHQIGKKIAQVCDLAIITTKDKFEDIKKGAIQNGMAESNIVFSENPKDIFILIKTFTNSGDAVLLEGRVPNELIKLLHVE